MAATFSSGASKRTTAVFLRRRTGPQTEILDRAPYNLVEYDFDTNPYPEMYVEPRNMSISSEAGLRQDEEVDAMLIDERQPYNEWMRFDIQKDQD